MFFVGNKKKYIIICWTKILCYVETSLIYCFILLILIFITVYVTKQINLDKKKRKDCIIIHTIIKLKIMVNVSLKFINPILWWNKQ